MSWLRLAKRIDLNEIESIAQQLRGQSVCEPGKKSKGECAILSHQLADALEAVGYDAEVAEGLFVSDYPQGWDEWLTDHGYSDEEASDFGYSEKDLEARRTHVHAVVLVGGYVVDITADQFNHLMNEPLPNVLIEAPDEGFYDHYDLGDDPSYAMA